MTKKIQLALSGVAAIASFIFYLSDDTGFVLSVCSAAVIFILVYLLLSLIRRKIFPEATAAAAKPQTTSSRRNDPVYNVIDVETPNHRNNRISSISLTKMQGAKILWTKTTLVNPMQNFDDFNIHLTGITPQSVADAPEFSQVWAEWKDDLLDGIIVAHNAPFDLTVINKCCKASGISFPDLKYIDTLDIAKNALPNIPHHKLDDVCAAFSIKLDHHRSESDCQACAEILRRFILKGIPVNDYICVFTDADLDFTDDKDYYRTHKAAKASEKTKSIQKLLDLLQDVSADGKITEQEVYNIKAWIDKHDDLKGNFPFDQIYACVTDALADGHLEPAELTAILNMCLFLIDPVKYATHHEHIDLNGKSVCVTGQCAYGSEEEVTELLTSCGAIVKPRVVATLDYLIVGSLGSAAWSTGNYGTKVKKAVEWRCKGKNIEIIRECDLDEVFYPQK